MVLEHVTRRDGQNNWSPITIENAIKMKHPRASYKDAIYRCELCGQYVTLALGKKNGFRHPPNDLDCYDKSDSKGYYPVRQKFFTKIEHGLPLCLRIVTGRIELSIGFLPLTESKMKACTDAKETIEVFGYSHAGIKGKCLLHRYINQDYFSTKATKYLQVGDLYDHYRLEFSSKGPEHYWAKYVDGIRDKGTLFDTETGERIPLNGEVKSNKSYHLLTKNKIWPISGIKCSRIRVKNLLEQWCLYEIKVLSKTEETQLFINQFHARLVDEPVKLIPLWPPYQRVGNVIEYSSQAFWFYRKSGYMKAYSITSLAKPTKYNRSNTGLFFQKWSNQDYQIVTMSQYDDVLSVMDYFVLRHQAIKTTEEPIQKSEIPFEDNEFSVWEPGVHNTLPKDRMLVIKSRCDGMIIIEKANHIRKEVFIKMGGERTIDLGWDTTISLYHGMDLVASIRFERSRQSDRVVANEQQLWSKLEQARGPTVALSHRMGWLAQKFKAYPMVQSWYIRQVRRGKISKEALFQLKKLGERYEND